MQLTFIERALIKGLVGNCWGKSEASNVVDLMSRTIKTIVDKQCTLFVYFDRQALMISRSST